MRIRLFPCLETNCYIKVIFRFNLKTSFDVTESIHNKAIKDTNLFALYYLLRPQDRSIITICFTVGADLSLINRDLLVDIKPFGVNNKQPKLCVGRYFYHSQQSIKLLEFR